MRILENSAKLFKILGVTYINQREDEIFISELWQTAIKSGSEKKVFQKSGQSHWEITMKDSIVR